MPNTPSNENGSLELGRSLNFFPMIYLFNIAFVLDQNGMSINQALANHNLEIPPPNNYF